MVPKHPPTIEVITLIEKTCQNMVKGEVEELRGEVKAILRKIQPPKSNISLEELKAMDELRKDDTRVILTVDKGVSLVVMNKEEYIKKAEELLLTDTYRMISNDLTNKHQTKLIKLLKTIKAEGRISEAVYKMLYPTGARVPKFYGLPKVHKEGIPLRPIVSSIGAASYETAKELARILKPLMGNSPYQVQNCRDFIQQIQDIKLKEDQCIMACDVKALFTSVPIQPAIDVIKKRLEEDGELQKRTSMSVQHIISLLEFCLRSTYFTFQDRLYEQQEGAAMGSPISPIVANLFMEDFENRAIESSPHPPCFWRRFVDDTFTIIYTPRKESFLEHLNSIDDHIQFTSEDPRPDGSMPFLDILIIPDQDGSLSTTVYRKPTHTDLYLQWDSHHTVSAKYGVARTLYHRAETICFSPLLLQQEEKHLQKALHRCKYPAWALNRVKIKQRSSAKRRSNTTKTGQNNPNQQKPYMVIPYFRGLSESLKKICSRHGVQVYFKGGNTIKNLLMAPRTKIQL